MFLLTALFFLQRHEIMLTQLGSIGNLGGLLRHIISAIFLPSFWCVLRIL